MGGHLLTQQERDEQYQDFVSFSVQARMLKREPDDAALEQLENAISLSSLPSFSKSMLTKFIATIKPSPKNGSV